MIAAIAADITTAAAMLAQGDTHRAEQYARAAHSAAVEASFDPALSTEAWALMDQADAILASL
ncbi:hypothetical protein [Rhodococcus zopfii]|uniref:hypothetical protein n=1 Tax=Rhodococcus zopfii TaxID=43772 RepID=UPI0035296FF9